MDAKLNFDPVAARADAPGLGRTLAAVLNSIPDAVLLLEKAGLIAFANSRAVHLFGFATVELLNAPIDTIMPGARHHAAARWQELFGATAASQDAAAPLQLAGVHKEGATLALEVSLRRLDVDGGRFALCAIRDVTEHARSHAAIAHSEARFNEAQRIAKIGSWERDVVERPGTGGPTSCTDMVRRGPCNGSRDNRSRCFLGAVHPEDRQRMGWTSSAARAPDGPNHDTRRDGRVAPAGRRRAGVFYSRGEVDFDEGISRLGPDVRNAARHHGTQGRFPSRAEPHGHALPRGAADRANRQLGVGPRHLEELVVRGALPDSRGRSGELRSFARELHAQSPPGRPPNSRARSEQHRSSIRRVQADADPSRARGRSRESRRADHPGAHGRERAARGRRRNGSRRDGAARARAAAARERRALREHGGARRDRHRHVDPRALRL